MSHVDIIRAWKDEEYRMSLSEAERTLLPAHPAGIIELEAAQLNVAGAARGTTGQKGSQVGCTPYCPTHIYDPKCGFTKPLGNCPIQ